MKEHCRREGMSGASRELSTHRASMIVIAGCREKIPRTQPMEKRAAHVGAIATKDLASASNSYRLSTARARCHGSMLAFERSHEVIRRALPQRVARRTHGATV